MMTAAVAPHGMTIATTTTTPHIMMTVTMTPIQGKDGNHDTTHGTKMVTVTPTQHNNCYRAAPLRRTAPSDAFEGDRRVETLTQVRGEEGDATQA